MVLSILSFGQITSMDVALSVPGNYDPYSPLNFFDTTQNLCVFPFETVVNTSGAVTVSFQTKATVSNLAVGGIKSYTYAYNKKKTVSFPTAGTYVIFDTVYISRISDTVSFVHTIENSSASLIHHDTTLVKLTLYPNTSIHLPFYNGTYNTMFSYQLVDNNLLSAHRFENHTPDFFYSGVDSIVPIIHLEQYGLNDFYGLSSKIFLIPGDWAVRLRVRSSVSVFSGGSIASLDTIIEMGIHLPLQLYSKTAGRLGDSLQYKHPKIPVQGADSVQIDMQAIIYSTQHDGVVVDSADIPLHTAYYNPNTSVLLAPLLHPYENIRSSVDTITLGNIVPPVYGDYIRTVPNILDYSGVGTFLSAYEMFDTLWVDSIPFGNELWNYRTMAITQGVNTQGLKGYQIVPYTNITVVSNNGAQRSVPIHYITNLPGYIFYNYIPNTVYFDCYNSNPSYNTDNYNTFQLKRQYIEYAIQELAHSDSFYVQEHTWGLVHAGQNIFLSPTVSRDTTYIGSSLNGTILSLANKPSEDLFEVEVFPNPTNGMVTIVLPKIGEYRMSLYDLTGRVLKEYQFSQKSCRVSLEKFPAGMYFCELENIRTGEIVVRNILREY